jgi:hypothetical protein
MGMTSTLQLFFCFILEVTESISEILENDGFRSHTSLSEKRDYEIFVDSPAYLESDKKYCL